jgi:hypothetical protein
LIGNASGIKPVMRGYGIEHQLSRSSSTEICVRRGGTNALRHNNSLNPTRDSLVVVMIPAAQVEGYSRGRVNSGVMLLRYL